MSDQNCLDLIHHAVECLKEYEFEQKETGTGFNIFEVTGINHKEVATSAFLAALLRPDGAHGLGILPLKLFCTHVLQVEVPSDFELAKARIETEVPIDAERRVDILLKFGARLIPIEVKIYAVDQSSQCSDYYQYALKYDPNTVLYYLTLDGHEPSLDSRRALKKDQQYRCISFEREISSWISAVLESSAVKKARNLYSTLCQYQLTVEHLTNRQAKEITGKMKDLINSRESIRAAIAIEKSLPAVKAEMMRKFFRALRDRLHGYETDFPLVFEGYDVCAGQYYAQTGSTWPSLNYLLPPLSKENNHCFVLRVEIDHNLYYGVCNWDNESKTNPHGLSEPMRQEILRASGSRDHKKKTSAYYWWEYLPADSEPIDFRNCNTAYEILYDDTFFRETIEKIASEMEDFFYTWLKNCRNDSV